MGMRISLQGLSDQSLRVTLSQRVQDSRPCCRSPSNRDRKPPCSCLRCCAGGGRLALTSSKPKSSSRLPRANKRPKDKRCCSYFSSLSFASATELRGTKDATRPSNPGGSVNWPSDDKGTRKTSRRTGGPNATLPAPGKGLCFPGAGSSILALCRDVPCCNNFRKNFSSDSQGTEKLWFSSLH